MKITAEFEIQNLLGLHARPAAKFVNTASGFASEITVEKDGDVVNGKSIMSLIILSAGKGSILKVTASGEDAAEAISAIKTLIDSKFDEG